MLPLVLKYLIGYIGISLVIIVHEIGHIVIAKLCGITVEVFSFGIGPRVWGKMAGRTEIRISLLPFGGYCRMKGNDDLNRALETKSKDFSNAEADSLFAVHPFKRFLTYMAGPFFNFLFASLLYATIASFPTTVISTPPVVVTVDDYPTIFKESSSNASLYGIQSGDLVRSFDGKEIGDYQELEDLLAGAKKGMHQFLLVRNGNAITIDAQANGEGRWGIANSIAPVVGQVRHGSEEEKAGLMKGDVIVSCNGKTITNNYDLLVALGKERKVTLSVLRHAEKMDISFVAASKEDGSGNFQFSLETGHKTQKGNRFSLIEGAKTSCRLFGQTLGTLWNVITGKTSDVRQEVTGTGRAALLIGDIATLGLEYDWKSGIRSLCYLLGIVSISLAVGNLLPLPAFDGGQILVSLFECVTGKRISPRSYWVLQLVGTCIVILILLLLTYVDLRHLYLVKVKHSFT
jgi:regulator of sigma E protease